MAFDKTLPANSTKLRNAPNVLTANFSAIEEADSSFKPYAINLQDRNPLGVSNDPATISGSSIIYVKQDGSGNPEIYSKDGSGNIIQMTVGGLLGGPSTAINGTTIQFGSSTRTNNQNAMVSAWALVTGTTLTASYGFASVAKPGTGLYTCTLTGSHMANANYAILVTASGTSLSGINAQVNTSVTKNTTQFGLKFIVASTGSATDVSSFNVMLVGGRA